jgi:Protein of unknown function (DUF3558)
VPPDRLPVGGARELSLRTAFPRYGRCVRVVRVLVALAVGCVSCTSTVVPPAPTPATGITLTPRPRDIRVDDVDPCSLLTPAQRAALKLEGEPREFARDGQFLGPSRSCTHLGFGTPNIAINIAVAPHRGIERYAAEPTRSDVSALVVEGYPAVLARPQTFNDFCTVALDVAPGQLIDVQYRDGGGDQPKVQMDVLCSSARQAASDVMETLLSH